MADAEDRPAPDVLLEAAKKEGRGRLKIFLGAYPGVGKTYTMLEVAQERRRDGVDVVVAVVETHGRAETEAILRGLEMLPRKQLIYRGRPFGEMDLDAVLERKPALAVVDELAHTNVPGSRHPKRWQDVDELLAAGIDVLTTLNIQHLESLNDIVARISRVRVRETLPDTVLELADEIELVDLPPDDLLQRLREGKVYVRDQIGRAIRNFFSKGNLTAFRELAMRVAATRVDAQMVDYMRAHAIPGPWPAQDRLLVCVNEAPVGKTLVRTASRMADRLRIPWIVVHVRTPRFESLPERDKARVAEALRVAESLGGEVATIHAESRLAEEVIAYARARNVTRLLVGRPRRRRLLGVLRENVSARLLKIGGAFEVTVVSPDAAEGEGAWIEGEKPAWRFDLRSYAWATAAVAIAAAVAFPIHRLMPFPNISLAFVTAVLVVALRFGFWPSLYASVLSFLTYNFLFTVPHFSFNVLRREDFLTILFFLIVATLVGNLAARLKEQVEAMRTTARRTDNLYNFSRSVAAAASLDDVLWAAVHHVASTLQCRSLVLLPDDRGELEIASGYPPEDELSVIDWGAAKWCWRHDRPAGWGSDTLPAADWLFFPLKTGRGPVGLLGISFETKPVGLGVEQRRLLEALVDQVAVSIERAHLAADIEEARVLAETEQLRSALLASVSHYLRTPLVSIIGSATTLSEVAGRLSDQDRRQLLSTILEEGDRLNRFVQNLLDMTRLGYGALQPNKEWSDIEEIAGRATRRLARDLAQRHFSRGIPEGLPAAFVDPVLIEQVLVNLLDNAVKYSGRDGSIHLAAAVEKNDLVVRVVDDGPGIPQEAHEAVFDVFYRVRSTDEQTAGTGLGLSICRGFVEAHGGAIRVAEGAPGRGTTVEFRLPLLAMPGVGDAMDRDGEEVRESG
jgi:two-component system sensor histidine kinase KdpD